MPRYAITIEYDGTPFAGWQVQAHGATVQGALVRAIAKFTGEQVLVRGAGRTDAGVHALAQVAHFDLSRHWQSGKIRDALNYHLKPDPVAVIECRAVAEGFDARHSATGRQYLYRILDRRARPVLTEGRVWWVPVPLDTVAMQAAAQQLVGHHDFTTFRATMCQAKSPVRTLERLDVARVGEEIHIWTEARSFLHNQVRSMVGTLKHVGEGRWTVEQARAALDARDRTRCGVVAPPAGLYLTAVRYPACALLPEVRTPYSPTIDRNS
jgi:tRNA pseudouridine38-40 synthase